jgi:STE24 endopeptidase
VHGWHGSALLRRAGLLLIQVLRDRCSRARAANFLRQASDPPGVSGVAVTLAVEVVAVSTSIWTDRRSRARALGMWLAAPAIPSVLASLMLMLVLLDWAGAWEPVLILGWLAIGPALLTRPGERTELRMSGFRRPTPAQRLQLEPAKRMAAKRCGADARGVDWYVQRSQDANAYACGRRGIAVTTGLLAALAAGTLTSQMLSGVLVHEVGHHASGATRYRLAVRWWAGPWRLASRFVLGLTYGLIGRRQPPRLLAVVVVTGVLVAITQAVQQHHWTVAAVWGALSVLGVSAPVLDAAISRRTECVADRYAADAGAGFDLASALGAVRTDMGDGGLLARLLAHHPDADQRITSLCTGLRSTA